MNSNPLPANHGAPVRIIAPGIAGARSVKWLECITVQASESEDHYQRRDYKILPAEATNKEEAKNFWDTTPALQDMPINSVIGVPQSGEAVEADADGTIAIKGYALPQGSDGPVVKVEVSVDEGKSWNEAELIGERGKWSWDTLGGSTACCKRTQAANLSRATDKAGNMQRDDSGWNLRGVAYHGFGEARDVKIL
jgi:sulfite oxidase